MTLLMEQTLDTGGPAVSVRAMRAEEKPAVKRIAFRALPLLARLFFSWSDTVLVAEYGGGLVGGVVLDTFAWAPGRKAGFVAWIFSDPDARGIGVGQSLVEAALAHFEAKGCDEVLACVEGHNASSSKLFATRGFGVLSPGTQWRRYGLRLPVVWWGTAHVIDVGHFLWARPAATEPDSPKAQWWGNLLANVLLAWISFRVWRAADLTPWVGTAGAMLLLLAARTLGMWLAARAQGLAVRYRAWETGLSLSLAIAVILRGVYVIPGGIYPQGYDWRYRELVPVLGRMALAGVAGPLALLWLLRAFSVDTGASPVLSHLFHVGIPMLTVDVLVPFFPLTCHNGRRLWDWSPVIWAIAAALVVALMLVR